MAAMTLGETVRVLERGGQDLVQGAGNRDDRGGGAERRDKPHFRSRGRDFR